MTTPDTPLHSGVETNEAHPCWKGPGVEHVKPALPGFCRDSRGACSMRSAMPLWRRRIQHRYNVHYCPFPAGSHVRTRNTRIYVPHMTRTPTSDIWCEPATKTLCGSRRRRELKRSSAHGVSYSQPLSARRQLPADLE